MDQISDNEIKNLETLARKLREKHNDDFERTMIGCNDKRTETIRISKDFYELIRKIAYEQHVSQTKVLNRLVANGLINSKYSDYLK